MPSLSGLGLGGAEGVFPSGSGVRGLYFGAECTAGAKSKSPGFLVGIPFGACGGAGLPGVLRRAKNALLWMTAAHGAAAATKSKSSLCGGGNSFRCRWWCRIARGPFDKLRAGSSSGEERPPLDDRFRLVLAFQLGDGTPPYFCSHFSSSRTFIFPCQGFLARLWPSPGKISSLLGMPSE
jgi:hypothetical protein